MSDKIVISLDLTLSRRALVWGFTAFYLVAAVGDLASENVTLTTYYPAPSGIYTQLVTTNQTILARDGDKVGVGTAAPGSKLSVGGPNGNVAIGGGYAGLAAPADGLIVAGSVGIKTSSPDTDLNVVASGGPNLRIGNVGCGGNAGLSAFTPNCANYAIVAGDGNTYINRNTGSGIHFREGNGTDQMVVASGGKVGIGTASPTASLQVSGSTGQRGYVYIDNSNSGCFSMSYPGDSGAGVGICSAGQYASWDPGLYIEGWRNLNHGSQVYTSGSGTNASITYLYQDNLANSVTFMVDNGPGVVYCCPK